MVKTEKKFKKGDLVFWDGPSGVRFWYLVAGFRRTKADWLCYLTSDCCSGYYPQQQLRLATIEQVIAYQRRKWGHSAKQTRAEIKRAEWLMS